MQAEQTKTPGQQAYEKDVRIIPLYPDGQHRKTWGELDDGIKRSWEINPKPRDYVSARKVFSSFDFNQVPTLRLNDTQTFVKIVSQVGEELIRKKSGEAAILVNRKILWLSEDENNDLVVCMSKDPVTFTRDKIEFNGLYMKVKEYSDLSDFDYENDIWVLQQWLRSRVTVPFSLKAMKVVAPKPH
ncbi:MAG: hypothetical protein ACTS9Y_00210 [Methylophilus sp.]|uniref:hypothetical protein n=1 Tax=Methylophilus sp. TaxID=29541 RepID=UPI003FA006B1